VCTAQTVFVAAFNVNNTFNISCEKTKPSVATVIKKMLQNIFCSMLNYMWDSLNAGLFHVE